MQLKDKAEIQSLVNAARGAQGFAAADDDAGEKIYALCAPVAAEFGDVNALPISTWFLLAAQIIPLTFGPDGLNPDNIIAVIKMIQQIFT